MSCIRVGTKVFDCETPKDPLCQRVFTYLGLTQTLSRAGTEWARSPSQNLNLNQSDYLFETVTSTLSLVDLASAVRDLPESISDSIVLSELVSVAGGRAGATDPIDAIFDSNAAAGQVVYVSGDNTVDLAQADAVATARAIGIAIDAVTAGQQGQYKPEGQVEITDWTAITGTATLTPGSIYFLSESLLGGLTTTPPSTSGETIVRVGRALTTTKLDIEIAQPVLL